MVNELMILAFLGLLTRLRHPATESDITTPSVHSESDALTVFGVVNSVQAYSPEAHIHASFFIQLVRR